MTRDFETSSYAAGYSLSMAVDFAAEEAGTLKRWREIDAFQTQLRLSQGRKPYTFYDGPVSSLSFRNHFPPASSGSAFSASARYAVAFPPSMLLVHALTEL